jgi:hypothetical protein
MTLTKRLAEVLFAVLRERTENTGLKQAIGDLEYSDWQSLYKAVAMLGLFPLFYSGLSDLKPAGLASDFLRQFKEAYLLNLQRNLFCEQELLKIISHLQGCDIAVIALKGPLLARLFYPDMTLRQAPVDLDLLIKKEALTQTQRILEELGYSHLQNEPKEDFLQPARQNHQITQLCLGKKTQDLWGFSLDIHTCIRGFYRQEQIEALWQQARYARVGEGKVLMLSNEDLLLYLSVISISLLESVQLRYLYDIHRLVTACQKELDWDKLLYKAKNYHLIPCLYFPLTLSRSLFRTEIPNNLLKDIAPGRVTKKLIALWIDKEQSSLQPEGIKFNLIARLILCRYLYSKGWGDFLNKLFTRSITRRYRMRRYPAFCGKGGKSEGYNNSQKEPRYSQPDHRGRNHSYAAL